MWSKQTPLCEIARKYHTDKTRTSDNGCSHNYTPYYDMLLAHRRAGLNRVNRVLEIGCGYPGLMHSEYGAGGSLRMWAEYFPEAEIFGLDLRQDALVNEGRIRSFLCDQSKEQDLCNVGARIGGTFDLIIDDGSHIAEHQILTAQIFVPRLNPDALYIIEDVHHPSVDVVRAGVGYMTALLEIPNPYGVDDRFIIIRAGEQCGDV